MILNEDFDTLDFDDEDYGESGEVEPGVPFDDGGETYYWKECIAGPIHIDFDNWAAWSAISEDDEIVYFVVDEDTGFIDLGPEESEEAIIQFLYGKLDDEELDESREPDKEDTVNLIDKYKSNFSNIDFYTTEKNDCPIIDYMMALEDKKLLAKMLSNMALLDELGNKARKPLSVYEGNGIYELRTKQSSNITRAFYFFIEGNKIIFTNGYTKKSQKCDENEYSKACRYRDDYIVREREGR